MLQAVQGPSKARVRAIRTSGAFAVEASMKAVTRREPWALQDVLTVLLGLNAQAAPSQPLGDTMTTTYRLKLCRDDQLRAWKAGEPDGG